MAETGEYGTYCTGNSGTADFRNCREKTVVSGSGRTDSGVHALGQECSLYLEQEIDMDSFKKQLNALLPEDIRVLDISREKRDFHARKSAVGKCYEYQIDLR